MAINVTMVTKPPSVPDTLAINSRVLSGSLSALYSAKTGTKALEKAPSANKRRRKFGIRLANKKTSAATPAPSKFATTTSRTKPRIREIKVMPLTTSPDFNNFLLTIYSLCFHKKLIGILAVCYRKIRKKLLKSAPIFCPRTFLV